MTNSTQTPLDPQTDIDDPFIHRSDYNEPVEDPDTEGVSDTDIDDEDDEDDEDEDEDLEYDPETDNE